uniref:Uncharacterized protein n=1 Tax=Knipowitschia caucasica TaxID=637954 RepID=A0AAV2KJG0_KNICA
MPPVSLSPLLMRTVLRPLRGRPGAPRFGSFRLTAPPGGSLPLILIRADCSAERFLLLLFFAARLNNGLRLLRRK